jgi:predicted kinase
MSTIYFLQGPPGSGKTTWAMELLKKQNGKAVRVNRDDLRAMMTDGKYSPDKEDMVKLVQKMITRVFIGGGKDVIVDNTNLKKADLEWVREVAAEDGNCNIEIVDYFVHTSLSVCQDRMVLRKSETGQEVVRMERLEQMMDTYKREFPAENKQ